MAITAESDIAKALNDHLLGLSGAWPIAWPNVPFTPPTTGRYYRAKDEPNDPIAPGLDNGGFIHRGIFLVSVVVKENEGEFVAKREAMRIRQRFERLTILPTPSGDLLIYERPRIAGGFLEKPNFEVPVVIRYTLTTD